MVILNMCQKWGGWVGPSAILDHMVNGLHGVLDFFIATHLVGIARKLSFFTVRTKLNNKHFANIPVRTIFRLRFCFNLLYF